MNRIYNEALRAKAAGEIDMDADDIRILPVMTNTTCDTENDGVTTISGANGFTTLDEFDGSGYTQGAGVALANEAVNKDDANDRAEFDADDAADPGWSDGTRQLQGLLLYQHVTDLTDSVPIAFIDGKYEVRAVADAAMSATTVWISPINRDIPSGTTLSFSGGNSATLSAKYTANGRSLSVNALGGPIAAGETAEFDSNDWPINGSNFSGAQWSAEGIIQYLDLQTAV